jgi:hypothetical protein
LQTDKPFKVFTFRTICSALKWKTSASDQKFYHFSLTTSNQQDHNRSKMIWLEYTEMLEPLKQAIIKKSRGKMDI